MDMLQLAGYGIDYRTRLITLGASDDERKQNMREGRASLRESTGQDFGYDPAAWHKHLAKDKEGGYTHPYAFRGVSRAIREAIRDSERRRLAQELGQEPTNSEPVAGQSTAEPGAAADPRRPSGSEG